MDNEIKTNFLGMINSPRDLRLLNKVQLRHLIREIRQRIISTVSKTGGHLASSLGTVELTVALHYVFSSPQDKIIWDVGHQAYTHKLLTGRNKYFETLRQKDGISGFPKITESIHDAFGTGHSSTAISAALGFAIARDLKRENNHVVAIVGDGALTGGMAFEGLNNAGINKTNILVILNDNEMSISKNVGAFASYLSKMVTKPKYHNVRRKLELMLRRLPKIGDKAAKSAFELEETIRAFSNPGLMFKDLGFNYFGPINGHDLDGLIKAFFNLKRMNGPVLLHILTQKGRGYKFAEKNKTQFHGVGAFDVESGEKIICANTISYTEAFSNALIKLARRDNKIIAITAAMASGTGLDKFAEQFPDRFFDVGIAEQHAVTFAGGLAINGFKPVVAIYSTFLQRAYDQLIHDICLQNLNVKFAIDRAGLVGEDGPTHHGAFDISYLRHIPNLIVMAPKDENEMQHMLYTAINYNGPVAIRYPRGCGIGIKLDDYFKSLRIGESEILKNGNDVFIFAVGHLVNEAIEASKILKRQGINCGIVNIRFIKPIDEKIILEITKKVKKIVVVEENVLQGGYGSALIEVLKDNNINAKVKRIGIPDKFIEHGDLDELRKNLGLSKEGIIEAIKEIL